MNIQCASRNVPPFFEGAVGSHIEAVGDGFNGEVTLSQIVGPRAEESGLQTGRQRPQTVVIIKVIITGGAFVDDRQVDAVVLAHVETGEIPGIVVEVDDLGLFHAISPAAAIHRVFQIVEIAVTLRRRRRGKICAVADIGEHLH